MRELEQKLGLAEFELAVQCCKAAFRDAAPDPPAVPAGLNWQQFLNSSPSIVSRVSRRRSSPSPIAAHPRRFARRLQKRWPG